MFKRTLFSACMLCLSVSAVQAQINIDSLKATVKRDQPAKPAVKLGPVDYQLRGYNDTYQNLYKQASEAEWKLNTEIIEGDSKNEQAYKLAKERLVHYQGLAVNHNMARSLMMKSDSLTPLQLMQLQRIRYMFGGNNEFATDTIRKRIALQASQISKLFGFRYQVSGKSVTPNDIDKILRTSVDLKERLAYWNASKEVGRELKPGLDETRKLLNVTVKMSAYPDFFDYQAAEYGMRGSEMIALCDSLISQVWPLYRELHTWARYTLAAKYGQPVPDLLPAHWLPNRWGQDWTELVEGSGLSLDEYLKQQDRDFILRKGESFYVSLGFDSLPDSFYTLSSLYPFPADSSVKKNNHASAWHMDLDQDVRSLMSIEPNTSWWGTTLHELGHIYYYKSYSRPEVPYILREGANRGFHEAIGSLIGLASLHTPLLQSQGMISKKVKTDPMKQLMQEALDYIVHIPWGAGVMTHFEHQLYAGNLPAGDFNKAWWELVKKYQGIEPPAARGEEYCDAATKTHIIDDQAQYYDYSISNVLLFMFHQHIATNILKQDPHATNYWGSKATGDFLRELMKPGASVDWRELLKQTVGSEMSAQPMLDYFKPLMEYLQKENKGRKYTLPETI